jgi:hypothetical protein
MNAAKSGISGSASTSRAAISASKSAGAKTPAAKAARNGVAISWCFGEPSTTSRHHCNRIKASIGSRPTSRARASSWLKA